MTLPAPISPQHLVKHYRTIEEEDMVGEETIVEDVNEEDMEVVIVYMII
jgi:hypothetical protein